MKNLSFSDPLASYVHPLLRPNQLCIEQSRRLDKLFTLIHAVLAAIC